MGFTVLFCGLVAAVTVELAQTGRFRAAVVLPPTALLGLVALLSSPAGPPHSWSVGLFGLVAVLALWSAHQHSLLASRPQAGVPRVAMGRRGLVPVGAAAVAGLLVVALGLPVVLHRALSGPKRYDPRNSQVLQPTETNDISPLARLDEFRSQAPPEALFTAGSGGFARWRLVGLTRYDGQAWMPSADFRPTGKNFDAVQTDAVEVDVTIAALHERWIPTPGDVEAVSARVRTDGASAGLLLDAPTAPGTAFRMKARPAAVSAAAATVGTLSSAVATRRPTAFTKGVDLPSSISLAAIDITKGASGDFERASRIEGYLKSKYQLDSQAIPGHTLALLQVFLDQTKRGRDEQFVAAFGVLGAAVGLPVRVVVGFDAQPDPATGAVTVTSKDIKTWPEVEFQGIGWVAFNPVPDVESPPVAGSNELPSDANQSNAGAARPAPPSTTPSAPPPSEPPAPETPPDGPLLSRRTLGVGLAVLVPLLLAGGYVAVVLALKRRRRARLRNGRSSDQVSGAFVSAMDLVVDLGGQAMPSLTDAELVDRAPPVLVASGVLDTLAGRSTTAVYGPRQAPPEVVDSAWTDASTFTEDTAKQVGRLRWMRARLSLRSLRQGLPDR
jgi:hypothetical protein